MGNRLLDHSTRAEDYCIIGVRDYEADMARRKKPQRFEKVKAVKSAARERLGAPPPTRRAPETKKHKGEKHKPTLGKMLGEAE